LKPAVCNAREIGCQLRAHPAFTSIHLAQEITNDPYNFDFLSATTPANAIRNAIYSATCSLPVGNQDFFIDLLFYHLKLRAYVVIDLEMKAFEPEFAGKMNSISQPSMTACGIPMTNQHRHQFLQDTTNESSPNTRCAISI
jgi:hypothetical protein